MDYAIRAVVNAQRTMLAGFTLMRELGAQSFGAPVAVRNAIYKGSIPGPRVLAAGKAIATTGGLADPTNAQEFEFIVEAGMPALEAIRSATLNAAKLAGVEETLGVIKAGKLADIVAVPDGPREDITTMMRVNFVMKDGTVYK